MRILVTGGNGFLGTYVCHALSNANHDVISYDSYIPTSTKENIKHITGSILDIDKLASVTNGIDCIFHLAALSDIYECDISPVKAVETNIIGTQNVLEVVKTNNVRRLIFSSSIYAFGEKGGIYSTTKKAAERLIKDYATSYGFKWTILRFGSIYGPGAPTSNGVYQIIKSALFDNEVIYTGSKNTVRKYLHVTDAANLCVEVLGDRFINCGVTINGNEKVKVSSLIDIIQEMLNTAKPTKFLDEDGSLQYLQTPYSKVLTKEISLQSNLSISLDQGVAEMIDYVSEQSNEK
jgi:UDP-glucose 4-epimerase